MFYWNKVPKYIMINKSKKLTINIQQGGKNIQITIYISYLYLNWKRNSLYLKLKKILNLKEKWEKTIS